MSKRIFILAALLLTLVRPTQAQNKEDCEATLNRAIEEFNAGHFYGISSLLNNCLNNGFSREQRERAYLLLAQSYLLLDDPFGAEQSYLSLLEANPEFVTDENRDPIDVVYLSKKFTASPIFSWFIKAGANVSTATVINNWSTVNGDRKYSLLPGIQFGGGLDYNFNEQFIVTAEVNLAFTGYKQREKNFFNGLDSKEARDKQSWFMVPIIGKYSFINKGKIRPYAYVGYSFNLLFRDINTISKVNSEPARTETGSATFTEDESPSLDFKFRRNTFNRSFLLGGGVKYKWGLNYFFADLRYNVGLTSIVNPKTRFADYRRSLTDQSGVMEATTRFAHVDDDFRLNNIFLSVGYLHPLYKPRKLKRARTKSILRNIRKNATDAEQK